MRGNIATCYTKCSSPAALKHASHLLNALLFVSRNRSSHMPYLVLESFSSARCSCTLLLLGTLTNMSHKHLVPASLEASPVLILLSNVSCCAYSEFRAISAVMSCESSHTIFSQQSPVRKRNSNIFLTYRSELTPNSCALRMCTTGYMYLCIIADSSVMNIF